MLGTVPLHCSCWAVQAKSRALSVTNDFFYLQRPWPHDLKTSANILCQLTLSRSDRSKERMWTALLKKSIRKSLQTRLPRKEFILSLNADQDTLKRFFSSGSYDSEKIGFDELASMLAKESNRSKNPEQKRGKKEKSNFDRDILLPASRGQLNKNHSSGIPRLAGRKHKASLAPKEKADRRRKSGSGTRFLMRDDDFDEGPWDDENDMLDDEAPKMFRTVTSDGEQVVTWPAAADEDFDAIEELNRMDSDKYFWEEEDFDPYLSEDDVENHRAMKSSDAAPEREMDDIEDDEEHEDEITNDENFDDEDYLYGSLDRYDIPRRKIRPARKRSENGSDPMVDLGIFHRRRKGRQVDNESDEEAEYDEEEAEYDEEKYDEEEEEEDDDEEEEEEEEEEDDDDDDEEEEEEDDHDDDEEEEDSDYDYDSDDGDVPIMSVPLPETILCRDGLVTAMFHNPSEYAHFVSNHAHPQSQREPKPFFPKGRAQPPKEFLEAHARFLFVTGLPPDVDGRDITDPLFRRSLQKQIAKLVGVDSQAVFPANATSAFVGFDSSEELSRALVVGPVEPTLKLSPKLSRCNEDDYNDAAKSFVKISPESTLELVNIPPGHTARSLIDNLIQSDESTAKVYGDVTTNDIYFISETRVLIRFRFKQQADAALESILWEQSLEQLGQYPIRYFRARRELVHVCFGGAGKSTEIRKVGPRLIVDSDMPSKSLYVSHAGTLHLRNLDPYVTKEEISAAFQPFCSRPHIAETSVEFVTCENGISTGEAYVGFDVVGDAEAAIKALSGAIKLGDRRSKLRLLSDRLIPGRPQAPPEKRPERSVEELLDDLNNWEKYVDQEDIKILEAHGVSKIVLDEALRGIRWNNKTFGAFDGSIRAEALEPEKERGEQYKELVQLYIATLKECLATPDDVGAIYESLHFPDEPIDLGIFDREKKRQDKLLKARNASK